MQPLVVQIALCDNASATKPVEVPQPLTHKTLLAAACNKFKTVTRQSRIFDGVSGEEILAGDDGAKVELTAAKVVCSGKAGWKGADRLRAQHTVDTDIPSASNDSVVPTMPNRGETSSHLSKDGGIMAVAASASAHAEIRASVPPLQVQLVSFSYDRGQPHETLVNLNARMLPNPGKAARGRTGLDKRLAREVLGTAGAAELCERVVQEALCQLEQLAAIVDGPWPSPVRVGVGCDRGLHRSVAVAEAATSLLARKAEKARSGRNRPGLEALLRGVELLEPEHRELARYQNGGLQGSGEPGFLQMVENLNVGVASEGSASASSSM